MTDDRYDAVLVGGGLQNALIALALRETHPAARIAMIERADRLGGEHTWCFHSDDVPREAVPFVDPLIEFRWPGYDVLFPGHRRSLGSAYAGFSSDRLRRVLSDRFEDGDLGVVMCGAEASDIDANHVRLKDGRRLTGALVVDARGPRKVAHGAGYQKFVGRELSLATPHGLARPVVMDATVPQRDGFRFMYLLPLAVDRLLVEDTVFSSVPTLDRDAMRGGIDEEVVRRGFDVRDIIREEEGVLPMPWTGLPEPPLRGPLLAGYRGGWLHPATGYSFPAAVRLASLVARGFPDKIFGTALRTRIREHRRQAKYAERLNGLLFRWFAPEDRVHVFERFYRLPEATIRRFYSLRMTALDRMRILVGRPPRGFSIRERVRRSAAVRKNEAVT